jgi:hypothetical protein
VVEGLTRLMLMVVDISNLMACEIAVSIDLKFHILQFAYDTVIVDEGNRDNLWSLKTLLRSLKLEGQFFSQVNSMVVLCH